MLTWIGLIAAGLVALMNDAWPESIACSVGALLLYTLWEKM